MLMRSANDSAVALAEHVGGSVEGFAELMNLKADELGLENSQFKNPHGLDEPGHYSSARDLLTIALAGMDNATFSQIVQTKTANMPDTPEGERRVATATNQLLTDYPGAIGVKDRVHGSRRSFPGFGCGTGRSSDVCGRPGLRRPFCRCVGPVGLRIRGVQHCHTGRQAAMSTRRGGFPDLEDGANAAEDFRSCSSESPRPRTSR